MSAFSQELNPTLISTISVALPLTLSKKLSVQPVINFLSLFLIFPSILNVMRLKHKRQSVDHQWLVRESIPVNKKWLQQTWTVITQTNTLSTWRRKVTRKRGSQGPRREDIIRKKIK
jgi:hypothetical protein